MLVCGVRRKLSSEERRASHTRRCPSGWALHSSRADTGIIHEVGRGDPPVIGMLIEGSVGGWNSSEIRTGFWFASDIVWIVVWTPDPNGFNAQGFNPGMICYRSGCVGVVESALHLRECLGFALEVVALKIALQRARLNRRCPLIHQICISSLRITRRPQLGSTTTTIIESINPEGFRRLSFGKRMHGWLSVAVGCPPSPYLTSKSSP